MAASGSESVTIDRAYFDTLLRRQAAIHRAVDIIPPGLSKSENGKANSHPSPRANFGSESSNPTVDPASLVSIPKAEHVSLLSVARQYANLTRNLTEGGVTDETIAVLSRDERVPGQVEPYPYAHPAAAYGPGHNDTLTNSSSAHYASPFFKNQLSQFAQQGNGSRLENAGYPTFFNHSFGVREQERSAGWPDVNGGDEEYSFSGEGPTPEATRIQHVNVLNQSQNSARAQFARFCRRTVMLSSLPDGATHLDITNAIRGGLILDIYFRAAEHIALVSFLREEDATQFHDHVRKHDIYIKNKRILIRWAERQFHLAGHVAGKIAVGATRNLVIRRCDPKHTEDSVRNDLDHIHNLVVIKVEFMRGSCYIKTNSVCNAMFARTCMMSRAKYKGSKIDWDADECEQPLQTVKPVLPSKQSPSTVKAPKKVNNRFATLRLDDSDDEIDDRFDTSSELLSTVDVTA